MFDILTTAAIADELSRTIVDGRVQRTGLRDRDTVVLEIYAQRRRHLLVATLAGKEPSCYLASNEIGIDASVMTPFSLLMRKHLRGGTVVVVDQPPLDRIIRLIIAKAPPDHRSTPERGVVEVVPNDEEAETDDEDDDGDITFTSLHIELMGRRSNIILTDNEGVVLDAIKRVPPSMSRARPVLPHLPYALPPAGDRIDPRSVTPGRIERLLGGAGRSDPATAPLVGGVAGMSPQIAREVVFRVSGDVSTPLGALPEGAEEAIARATQELFGALEGSTWNPQAYEDDTGRLVAYAPIPLLHLDRSLISRPVEPISALVELAHSGAASASRHGARRDRLAGQIERAAERAAAKLATLEHQRQELLDADRYRRWGEAIFAKLWTIAPGQRELSIDGETIPLDPAIAPKDQAQSYFSRYRKYGRGLGEVEASIRTATNEIGYLEQIGTLVSQAESFDEIETLRREWDATTSTISHRDGQPPRRTKKPAAPKPIVDPHGNRISIGRSAQQNEMITFDIAGPDDYWLHARGVPGSHVVVRPPNARMEVDDQTLYAAAAYAAYFSASRNDTSVEVDICRRRDVRKIKGAGPGMVTYRNERTVNVKPKAPGAR